MFCVDEVIVFNDGQTRSRPPEQGGYTAFADPDFFLYHVLSYLETPPHLRKGLFPMHPDLRTAGALPSLDMPHHLRSDESCSFREGLVIESKTSKTGITGSIVDCGLREHVFLPVQMEAGTRVTVKLSAVIDGSGKRATEGEAISPDAPREENGYYWGYSVRQASSLSNVFTECPYNGGYDMSIGTSERGAFLASLFDRNSKHSIEPTWNHLLICFGGVSGLESALTSDHELLASGVQKVEELFDSWVNLVPGQGSRTIRTEEAVWVGLTAMRPLVEKRNAVEELRHPG